VTLETQGTAALSASQRAIFRVVAYGDVFDFPMTPEEIQRALPVQASLSDVAAALTDCTRSGLLSTAEPYYVLAGREALVATRDRRAIASSSLMRRADRYGSLIARLPFVRMVAVTGSLAAANAEADDDIDYLIVTAKGRLWLARGLTIFVVRLAKLRGLTLCPNYMLSETALALDERDAYTARELAQMRLVSGRDVYLRMLAENGWCTELIPNWTPGANDAVEAGSIVARLGEWLLGGRLGDALERLLLRRKGGELRDRAGGNREVLFSEDVCKGHFEAHRARLEVALAQRMQRLGAEE